MGAFNELGDFVLRIIEVAKCDGLGRACFGAGCNVFMLLKLFAFFRISLVFGTHEPVVAERAFLNNTPHPG